MANNPELIRQDTADAIGDHTFNAGEDANNDNVNSKLASVDDGETDRDGFQGPQLDQSVSDVQSRHLETTKQKTYTKVLSFNNLRTQLVNDGAAMMNYSVIPDQDKQESSEKASQSVAKQDQEEQMELPQLDEDSA